MPKQYSDEAPRSPYDTKIEVSALHRPASSILAEGERPFEQEARAHSQHVEGLVRQQQTTPGVAEEDARVAEAKARLERGYFRESATGERAYLTPFYSIGTVPVLQAGSEGKKHVKK
jgi:hypothetical protein